MGRDRKPHRLALGALVALAVGAGGLPSSAPSARAQVVVDDRPNIVVIVTDDQRAGTLSVMPATRRLFQKEGRRFPRAFATTPLCCPARASIFTGLYMHNHGVLTNGAGRRLVQEDTMQRYLQEAGYNTAIVGKFLNGWPTSNNPPYFDRWSISAGGYYSTRFNVDGDMQEVEDYSTHFMTQRALSYLREFQVGPQPWFLYLAPYAPHSPYTPEPKYEDAPVPRFQVNPAMRERDRSDKPSWVRRRRVALSTQRHVRRQQLRTLMSVDDMVKDVFAQLEHLGEADNTIAFFLSDNGFLWGEHGLATKRYPYTHSVKIPMLMRWPAVVQGGTRDTRFVGNVDVAPTVLAAAGADAPMMDGRALLNDHSRTRMLLEFNRDVHWKKIPTWASIRTRRYQFVEYYRDDGSIRFREFYRLRKDPWQLTNILRDGIRQNNPNLRKLHRLLKRDRRCSGSTCP